MGMAMLLKCLGGSSASTLTKQASTGIGDNLCHRFSLSQLRKSTDDFDKSRIICEGPYGAFYRASISINGQFKDIALKRLRPPEPYGISVYKKEIIFMCQLRHHNLVSFLGFCDERNEMILVYDYARKESLYRQLHGVEGKPPPTVSWKKRLEISIGVARGLHYLHSGTKRTIIHRNTSTGNIILDENWVPKLAFFGMSVKGAKFSDKEVKPVEVEGAVGTVGYIAPECFSPAPNVTHKCDVYSFGAVLIELICGKPPHRVMSRHKVGDLKEVLNLADTGKAEGKFIDERLEGEVAAECWKLYMDITGSCLSEDPNERPDMGDVEVQLERLLHLQEEADSNHTHHAFFI